MPLSESQRSEWGYNVACARRQIKQYTARPVALATVLAVADHLAAVEAALREVLACEKCDGEGALQVGFDPPRWIACPRRERARAALAPTVTP